MRIAKKLLMVLLTGIFALGLVGCGGSNVPAGFKRIQFTAVVDEYTSAYFTELYQTYNATQGQEDKVYVAFQPVGESYLTSLATMLSGRRSNAQVLATTATLKTMRCRTVLSTSTNCFPMSRCESSMKTEMRCLTSRACLQGL